MEPMDYSTYMETQESPAEDLLGTFEAIEREEDNETLGTFQAIEREAGWNFGNVFTHY